MSDIGRYDPEHKDDVKFEERCPVCIHWEDSWEDPRTCGACFGIKKDGITRYQYKHFKRE